MFVILWFYNFVGTNTRKEIFMFGTERIGNFEVRPMGDGKYSYTTTIPGNMAAGVLYGEKALEEFRAKHSLERVPDNDEVIFKNNGNADKIEISMDNIKNEVRNYQYDVEPDVFYRASKMKSESGLDLNISNGFLGLSDRKIKGKHQDLDVDLKLGDNMFNHFKGSLKGKIGDKEFDLKYKLTDKKDKIKLEGKGLDNCTDAERNLLSVFILGNVIHNVHRDN